MVKFSLVPPLRNEPCMVQCHDGFRTYSYEMRGDPEFTDAELVDIQPEVRGIFMEWLKGAQDRYRRSRGLERGIYGVTNDGGDSTVRDREHEEKAGDDNNRKRRKWKQSKR